MALTCHNDVFNDVAMTSRKNLRRKVCNSRRKKFVVFVVFAMTCLFFCDDLSPQKVLVEFFKGDSTGYSINKL